MHVYGKNENYQFFFISCTYLTTSSVTLINLVNNPFLHIWYAVLNILLNSNAEIGEQFELNLNLNILINTYFIKLTHWTTIYWFIVYTYAHFEEYHWKLRCSTPALTSVLNHGLPHTMHCVIYTYNKRTQSVMIPRLPAMLL